MNLNKLREAVSIIKEKREIALSTQWCPEAVSKFNDALESLIIFTEDVIRLQGKMPKKRGMLSSKDFNTMTDEQYAQKTDQNIGYNLAIDDCVKAMALNENYLHDIIYCTTQYLPLPDKDVAVLNGRLAKAIMTGKEK